MVTKKITLAKKSAVVIVLLGFSMACQLLTPTVDGAVVLSDCYQVRFLETSQITDQVSIWRYEVEELSCAQDLSNWALELPACATIVDASPSPWEVVHPDPNYHFDGIKWQTGTDFQSGEFTVALSGELMSGVVQVGVKGPDAAIGTIAGPVCKTTTITPTVTTTPDTVTPTEEGTPAPTETASAPTVQPPASSGPIVITENGQTLTFTCNGNAVEVRGNANVITLLGSCSSITVKGNANQVYWQSGSPVIVNTGNENIISQR
ncbi:MAG: DUF3060 domain-containing protein [Chloroflexota bacterium]